MFTRSVQHVCDYSRDAGRVEPAVAKTESEELGRNIAEAQQEFTAARQKAGSDPATVEALISIEKHLAAAANQHKMLDQERCKQPDDGAVRMGCCNTISLELDKAQAEHDALIRDLELKAKTSE